MIIDFNRIKKEEDELKVVMDDQAVYRFRSAKKVLLPGSREWLVYSSLKYSRGRIILNCDNDSQLLFTHKSLGIVNKVLYPS